MNARTCVFPSNRNSFEPLDDIEQNRTEKKRRLLPSNEFYNIILLLIVSGVGHRVIRRRSEKLGATRRTKQNKEKLVKSGVTVSLCSSSFPIVSPIFSEFVRVSLWPCPDFILEQRIWISQKKNRPRHKTVFLCSLTRIIIFHITVYNVCMCIKHVRATSGHTQHKNPHIKRQKQNIQLLYYYIY